MRNLKRMHLLNGAIKIPGGEKCKTEKQQQSQRKARGRVQNTDVSFETI
jgi:hypothetical protein